MQRGKRSCGSLEGKPNLLLVFFSHKLSSDLLVLTHAQSGTPVNENPAADALGRAAGWRAGEGLDWPYAVSVFRVTMYDYQAMCKPPSHHHSAAWSLVSVSVTPHIPSTSPKMRSPGPWFHQPQASGPTLDSDQKSSPTSACTAEPCMQPAPTLVPQG